MSRVRTSQVQHAPCSNGMPPGMETKSQFLVRTSNFFKKVTKLRGNRKVSMDTNGALNDSSTRDAATFAARQVALGRKSFGFSQPVLGVHPMTLDGMHRRTVSDQDSDMSFSGTTSPMGSAAGASASDRSSHHHGNVTAPQPRSVSLPNTQIPQSRSIPNGYQDRPPPVPPKSHSATHDGLPRTSNVGTQQPPPSRMSSNNMTSNGTRPPSQRFSSSETRAQTLPSRKFVTTPNNTTSSSPTTTTSPPACRGTTLVRSSPISSPPPNTTHTTASTPASPSLSTSTPTSTPRPSAQTAKTSASLARDRSLHLRLASLPPPMMARYNTQGSARLTPSFVVPRPMPMPLLNLPTLPPSTPSIPHSAGDGNQREGREGRRRAPLRSMPALPLTGPRDDENPDMDEEGSDEDSEEGEGEDDHYHDTMRDHDEGVSEDEMDLDTPSPQLPLVDTSPLGISLSFIAGRSAVAQQRLREIEREAATLFATPPSISAGVFSPSPLSASFSSSSRRPATATGVTSSASASGLGFASSPVSSTSSRPSAPTASSPTFPPRTSSLDYFSHNAQSSEGGSWSSTPSQDAPKMEDTSKTPRPSDFLSKTPLTSDSKTGKEADYDKTPHTVSSRKTQFLRDAEEHGASKESSDDEDGALLPKIIPIPPTPNSSLPPSISSRSPTSPGRILGRSTVITPPVSPPLPSHPPSAFPGIPIPPSPGPESAYRPGLYHHASKSMVDLTPYARKSDKMKEDLDGVGSEERYRTPLMDSAISEVASMKEEEGDTGASPQMVGSPRSPPLGGGAGTPSRRGTVTATAQLRRQRSLPTYSPATLPPPYPAFLSNFNRHVFQIQIQPREEEGNEKLPVYTNSIYLVAMMPRKMEFTAPGVQARERKWRRVIVVLEGTALRIYRTHGAGSQGKGGKVGEWWERAVGVGDWSSGQYGVGGVGGSQGVRASALRERERRLNGDEPPVTPLKVDREREREREREQETRGVEFPESSRPSSARSRQESPTSPSAIATTPTSGASRSGFLQSAAGLLHPSRSGQGSRLGSPSWVNTSGSRLSLETGGGSGRNSDREEGSLRPGTASSASGVGRRSVDILNASSSSSSRNLVSSSSGSLSTTAVSPPSSAGAGGGLRGRTPSTNANASSYHNMSAYASQSGGGGSSGGGGRTRTTKLPPVVQQYVEPPQVSVPDEKDLLRLYSLQNAESGLASDYTKRKNVIRLRLEGEQFLLQARDVGGVIDWIEGIQAATNVALDLDERPMPKGPLFPRRRRRRRRVDGTTEPPRNPVESPSLRHQPSTS